MIRAPAIRVLIVVVPLLVLVGLVSGFVRHQLVQPVTEDALFNIEPGSNLVVVTQRLTTSELLPVNGNVFKALALVTRSAGAIRAGQYQIKQGMTSLDLLALFRSGKVKQHKLTFPEGWSLNQWLALMRQAPYLEIKTTSMTRAQLSLSLGIDGDPEGWLFPDTYQYTKGDSDLEILVLAHTKMNRVLEEQWQQRGILGFIDSPYQALVLASMIEKETGFHPDREKIASVFHNRLIKGMKLQSDPTVIYGLGNGFNGDLTRQDLKVDTLYNTYTRTGLPPTPICSPGRASIHAALTASAHPYLYFVAKGNGQSQFSISLKEHNEAVNRYQKKQGR